MPASKVLTSLENSAGDHCVDIFVRADGTFGFEEYRRDPEDVSGRFSLHRYSHQMFATTEDAGGGEIKGGMDGFGWRIAVLKAWQGPGGSA